ncbi:plasmolipin [Ischnura elegans]|uniref:plasmolipin n=1 Tax=Ischnura elegans TaxID=197161 RepID=UPI001ED8B4F6|nr:plasmolipin [Ischnura elegans]XP_046385873.1 plasmolipin [Ischnura elegans]XP_046385874.1 plasmolipin [Ischnura elegans]
MADRGFPDQHTTTTVTSTNTTVQTNIRFDASYVRTLPGMLKVGQMVVDILGFICIIASNWSHSSRGSWFNTVAMGGFWFTGIMLALYLFHIVEKLYRIPWLKIEFIFCTLWVLFYLIAASLAAAIGGAIEAFAAAAFFGFVGMILYGFDAYIKFKAIKGGEIAQGERVVIKSTSTAASPAY